MYLVFKLTPGDGYRRRFRSLLLRPLLCVWRQSIAVNSHCWFCTSALSLVLSHIPGKLAHSETWSNPCHYWSLCLLLLRLYFIINAFKTAIYHFFSFFLSLFYFIFLLIDNFFLFCCYRQHDRLNVHVCIVDEIILGSQRPGAMFCPSSSVVPACALAWAQNLDVVTVEWS